MVQDDDGLGVVVYAISADGLKSSMRYDLKGLLRGFLDVIDTLCDNWTGVVVSHDMLRTYRDIVPSFDNFPAR